MSPSGSGRSGSGTEWEAAAARQKELVGAVKEVSATLKDLTAQLRDDAEANAAFRGAIMERVRR